jgi:hypothetical protein
MNARQIGVVRSAVPPAPRQETLALLKMLALGNQQIAQGKLKPVAEVVKRLRTQKVSGRLP